MKIVHNREELTWEGNNLKYQGKTLVDIVPLWKVRWGEEGMLSEDFYNKDRAKENSVQVALSILNNTPLDTK